ncbi:predicted protein [Lichtheimia corymbifera JMRC:FSU:9682]|uniref:Uncharacterized protein n=1 Tax=Lichtheimia corymbifera JMRC:FSU:9682 TaxID=1263082 RepID=A0A068SIL2_9FUNG|nr:predicted protein [Lichtheimia corymbifera JMRC:FSU:9682]
MVQGQTVIRSLAGAALDAKMEDAHVVEYCTLKCHSQSTRNCSNTNLPSTSNRGKSRRHRISKPEIARRPITRSLSTRQTRSARR